MNVTDVLNKFDKYLASKDYAFTGIVIGGAALIIMNICSRATRDIDFLDPELEKDFLKLADEFRTSNKELNLQEDWINNGPISLKVDLPKDWRLRLVTIFTGEALTLQSLGREDFLKSKLFAYCDRDIDLQDCIDLKPTTKELDDSTEWLKLRDANPLWPERVEAQIEYLKEKLSE